MGDHGRRCGCGRPLTGRAAQCLSCYVLSRPNQRLLPRGQKATKNWIKAQGDYRAMDRWAERGFVSG